MIGFGLSLQGGCIAADERGSTHLPDYREGHVRGYFPAKQLEYRNMLGTTLSLIAYSKKLSTNADWDMYATACSFACRIIERGSRISATTLGTLSYYSNQDGDSSYPGYSSCHLRLTSRLYTTVGGNITTLQYSNAGLEYKTGADSFKNWDTIISCSNTGDFRLEINNMQLKANVFGQNIEESLPSFRYRSDLAKYQTLHLFGAGNVDMQFFHSCWRNNATRQAWLCLPMQSADGKAALFEFTTKQMIEDETLSVA